MSLFVLAGLSCGIACVILSVLTLFFGKTKLHRLLLFFNIAVAFWGFGLFLAGTANNESNAIFGWQIAHLGGFFIGTFFYHMTCVFCGIDRRKLVNLAYSQAIVFNLLSFGTKNLFNKTRFVFDIYYNEATPLLVVGILFYLSFVILSYYELSKYLHTAQGYKRTQTLYLIFGFLIGFIGGTSTFLPEFRIDILYPFGNFGITVYCLIVTYAILRYRLLNISLVFKKTVVYSLSAGLLTGLFVVLVFTATNLFSAFAHVSSFAISIFSAILIAILFNPLRNKIQDLIDKIFYKKSYDYYAIIQQVNSTLASMFELKKIFHFSCNVIYEAMGLKSVYLLAAGPRGAYDVVYEVSLKKDKSKRKDEAVKEEKIKISEYAEVIKFFKLSDDILINDELPGYEKLLGMETIEQIKKELEVLHGEALVPVFIDNKVSLLLILGGKISGDMFTNEDINLLKTISQQTAIAVKTARLYSEKVRAERLASIGMMSASFAHEIKNPLTAIKTFAQLIPEKYTDVDFRENFSKIVINSVHRIDRLITDLLDYSSDRIFTGVSSLNITDVVDRTLNEVKTTLELEKKNISFEKNYKKVKIDISGDEGKLRQALVNIITNGCQAIPNDQPGIVKVGIYPNKENVSISVTDNGEGVSSENMPRMFEPFFSTKTIGVGLGLAITKKIIENHNGRISVESKLKEGTTFTLILPMQNHGK